MKKRGCGIGSMWYGIGNTGLPNPSGAFVQVLDDCTVIIHTGCADIGQGSTTVLAQIAAEELGVNFNDISVICADTGVTPDAGKTSASRQTYISGNAVRKAAQSAKETIFKKGAELLQVPEEELILKNYQLNSLKNYNIQISLKEIMAKCREDGTLVIGHGWFNPQTKGLDKRGQGIPYATYAFATQWVEVEVDTETGEIDILNVVAAHDVGKAVNPMAVEGQIEGGSVMGAGYALMEEIILDDGKIINSSFSNYLIPTIKDVPCVNSIIVEEEEVTGPFGAKGVGEPALIPTATAIANAISNALGIRFYELPITPEKILNSLKTANNTNKNQRDF
ncbi:MAG TPA: nicotinate dehydrogenase medium molybdopterin subunit [Desulfotomaculum sp.]|nr:MAG: nicotinate dehydrogenase medium molybdopterin subunit [Peptococcaceae bacterium BRH_c8a]KJS71577.1 MAG: nicotinate dehydrogenase medium molybdopterin subunit [Desulfotomaculum sp. BICA1-6]HBX24217.1 nicotinate dehydrogenase medium molybdopterin subunit [Desulfotomaculum sp.]